MAVAKRQEREKHSKIEQRKVQGLELEPQVEQTALLASSIYIRQAQRKEKKTYKKRSQRARGFSPLSLSLCFLGLHALIPPGCISLYLPNKTEL